MKILLSFLLFLILFSGHVSAQHYSCVSSEYKTWFTNAKGYLKGMRIDSTQVVGGQKIYYPFRTARVAAGMDGVADTMGGCWLGKTIVENPDGTATYIQNKWGDTILIRNNAHLNESWIFYHDTSSVYISATVTDQGIAEVGGTIDSVKTIQLTVMNGATALSDDSLTGIELVLSKEHGFVQTIELYLLPFRTPDEHSYNRRIDMYLNEYLAPWTGTFDRQHLMFKRVNYIVPNNLSIYNFNIGDVLITRSSNPFGSSYEYVDVRDSVTNRTGSAQAINYTFHRSYYGRRLNEHGTALESFSGVDSHPGMASYELLRDTVKMPEEWFTEDYDYFWEGDTSFCYKSNVHGWHNHFLREFGEIYIFEDTRNTWRYKDGLGALNLHWVSFPTESGYSIYLRGARKNGILCGEDNLPLAIGNIRQTELQAEVYPNPTHDILQIRVSTPSPFSVSLYNLLGAETGLRSESSANSTLLNVSGLPSGIYLLKIESKTGRLIRKIIVGH